MSSSRRMRNYSNFVKSFADEKLISGSFLTEEISKDKTWLWKYFKTDMQKSFILYYYQFSHFMTWGRQEFTRNFIDHTGYFVRQEILIRWLKKLIMLESALQKATDDFDFETVKTIKDGAFFKEKKE